jgi:hypothetical protein
MSNPNRVLIWMTLFLMGTLLSATMLVEPLTEAFLANQVFNGMIIGVLLIGVIVNIRQVIILQPDVAWLDEFPRSLKDRNLEPHLLTPMAKMLEKRKRGYRMSAMTMRSVLDGIRMRLDESRDISRYLTGLLVFLGLLGTFWGLLDTIGGVSAVIAELSTGEEGDVAASFKHLMESIQAPLAGMGTAFSSSLFGLAGAVVIGFLDLQAGHAQNRFYNELEDRLSDISHVTSGTVGIEHDQSLSGYVEGLLEQTAESLDKLQSVMSRNEEDRLASTSRQMELNERIAELTDQIRSEQKAVTRMGQSHADLHPLLVQLGEKIDSSGDGDEALRRHIRNLDIGITQLVSETVTSRERLVEEFRKEIRLLGHTLNKRPQQGDE